MNDELRQQLWDLLYGLLEPEEASALKARITSEPAVARLYSEVSLQKDLVADAASIEVAPIELPSQHKSAAPAAAAVPAFKRSRSSASQPVRWANVLVGLSAVVLMGIFATSIWRRPPERMVTSHEHGPAGSTPQAGMPAEAMKKASASSAMVAEIHAPQTIVAGMTQRFVVTTRTEDERQPVASSWQVRLVDEAGQDRFVKQVQTDSNGQSAVEIPGRALRTGSTLVVDPLDPSGAVASGRKSLTVPLNIAAPSLTAHLETDRPIARPGETVGVRSVVLGSQSQAIENEIPAEFELFDSAGNAVPGTLNRDVTHYGVAAADAILPSNLADGIYEVAVRSPQGSFPEQRTRLLVQRDGALSVLGLDPSDRQEVALAFRNGGSSFQMEELKRREKQLDRSAVEKRADYLRKMAVEERMLEEEQADNAKPGLSAKKGPERNQNLAGGGGAFGAASGAAAPLDQKQASRGRPKTPLAADGAMKVAGAPPGPSPAAAPLAVQEDVVTNRGVNEPSTKELGGNEVRSNGLSSNDPGALEALAVADSEMPSAPAPQAMAAPVADKPAGKLDERAKDGEADRRQVAIQVLEDNADGLVLELSPSSGEQMVVVSNADGVTLTRATFGELRKKEFFHQKLQQPEKKQELAATASNSQRVQVTLPPEASGDLQIEVVQVDATKEHSSQITWNRRAHRFAELAIEKLSAEYAAGEEVELELTSRDEHGEPLPAVLGIRVLNEELAGWVDEPSQVTDDLALARNAGDASAKFFRRDAKMLAEPTQENSLAQTEGSDAQLRAGTDKSESMAMGAVQAGGEAPSVVSTKPELVVLAQQEFVPPADEQSSKTPRDRKREAAATLKNHRERANEILQQRAIARFLIAAGLLGLMIVGVVGMLRLRVRAWVVGPAIMAAVACLVIGVIRLPHSHPPHMMAERSDANGPAKSLPSSIPSSPPGNPQAVEASAPADQVEIPAETPATLPLAQAHAEMDKSLVLEEKATAKQNSYAAVPTSVPVTLYWNPRLLTDENGKAKIRFQLPAEGGRYRVLVDAHGEGRLGQSQLVINIPRPLAKSKEDAKQAEAAAAEVNSQPPPATEAPFPAAPTPE